MSSVKKQTKQDLENKIAELESRLNNLASQLEAKVVAQKPAEVKPAEVKTQTPLTLQEALENNYQNARMTDFHWYREHVTGYSPAPNRYFVRNTAPVGKISTTNWNDQKAKVPGYTQPSNQYFATRPRLAYHPANKRFGSFSGVSLTVDGSASHAQSYQSPPPKSNKGTLPKGTEQTQVSSNDLNSGKSRKDQLVEYEADYLLRAQQQKVEQEKIYQESIEAEVKSRTNTTRGSLPKGFESNTTSEQPKISKGTLPKGF